MTLDRYKILSRHRDSCYKYNAFNSTGPVHMRLSSRDMAQLTTISKKGSFVTVEVNNEWITRKAVKMPRPHLQGTATKKQSAQEVDPRKSKAVCGNKSFAGLTTSVVGMYKLATFGPEIRQHEQRVYRGRTRYE